MHGFEQAPERQKHATTSAEAPPDLGWHPQGETNRITPRTDPGYVYNDFVHRFSEAGAMATLAGVVMEPARIPSLAATVSPQDYRGLFASITPNETRTAFLLNKNHSFEDPTMFRAQMRGAAKGLGVGLATIGGDMAVDYFAFRNQRSGAATMFADTIGTAAIFFSPLNWGVKAPLAVGAHALGRYLDSIIDQKQKK